MSKAKKSTLGPRRDQGRAPFFGTGAAQPTLAGIPAAVPAPVVRTESKPKATPKRTARTERSTTLTVEAVVDRNVYTREEAARYLGTSPATLWRVAQAGQDRDGKRLGHTRIGTRVRFLREDLDRYSHNEEPRAGATIGWQKDEDRAERMRQQHAARRAQG